MANETLRRKLNESRTELQKFEEIHSQLRGQLNQSQTECIILKEVTFFSLILIPEAHSE